MDDIHEMEDTSLPQQPVPSFQPAPTIAPTTPPVPKLTIDNVRSLIEVQTPLYADMHSILVDIYGSEQLIVCRQFRVQNIIQKHFIAMRNELHKEMRDAIHEVACKKSWWQTILCR
jgi:hypothetical protein